MGIRLFSFFGVTDNDERECGNSNREEVVPLQGKYFIRFLIEKGTFVKNDDLDFVVDESL
jgi:hypothetical protein